MGRSGNRLRANAHAWNAFASVLFIDSPAFTGFSYSDDTDDLVTGEHGLSNRISLVQRQASFGRSLSAGADG